jgi:N-acetylmuramoyl-L-alanine amidase
MRFPIHRTASLTAAFVLAGAAAQAAPDGYVPLARVALRYHLAFTRDSVSGVVVCEGNGTRVTAGPALSCVLLNGEALRLTRPVIEEDGVVYIPSEVAGAIDAQAARRPAPPAVAAKRPAVAVAEPAPSRPAASPRPGGAIPPPARAFTVVIDPGHGGDHSGARGRSGVTEKSVNLDVARRLQRHLEAAGMRAILTRTSDAHFSPHVQDDLHRRFDLCNRTVPDLFLSIHSNWAEDSSARGFEIYIRRERPADERQKRSDAARLRFPSDRAGAAAAEDPAVGRMLLDLLIDRSEDGSRLAAREIERSMARGIATENRGIRERDFQVVRWTHAPAVLVELEFLSNPRGERELGSPAHREHLAKTLSEAVAAFRARWAPGTGSGDRSGVFAAHTAESHVPSRPPRALHAGPGARARFAPSRSRVTALRPRRPSITIARP